jgi:hypothetical protein
MYLALTVTVSMLLWAIIFLAWTAGGGPLFFALLFVVLVMLLGSEFVG